ncbi:MAG: hypothetical protein H6828_11580 [Planctomycetes bacterium]|nr:hypothetical protein [Planctomycetota bacterium]
MKLLALAPLVICLLTACAGPRGLGVAQDGREVYLDTRDEAAVAAVARAATARVVDLPLEELLRDARGDLEAQRAAGELGSADLRWLDRARVEVRFAPEPLETETILAQQRTRWAWSKGTLLDDADFGDALDGRDVLLRVGAQVAPWPEGEAYTAHPELVLVQAEVTWWSRHAGDGTDRALAVALAARDWTYRALLEELARAGLREVEPGATP